jgi:His/Glu/Gln/Arg/opine family amino acid ABC transporter permease subunit
MNRTVGADGAGRPERIPFWRNVKTLGIIAQVVFLAVVVAAIAIVVNNTLTALARANLPADFGFLRARAGIPIAEVPIPYTINDPYWRALLIGFLNTLRVALIGVVLASLIGVAVGLMRLAKNWLVRTIATVYIELLRNIPLAVQIVFWYSAVLLPIPPRINNAIELPGGALLSNNGVALPFAYPTYLFGAWVPWIVAAVAIAVVAYVWRRRAVARAERPGRAWPLPLAAFVLVLGGGYLVVAQDDSLPDGIAVDFNVDRGRGTVFIDTDGDGRRAPSERVAPFANTLVRVPEAELVTATQNLTESRRLVRSTFRFPLIRVGDVEEVRVEFVDEELAEEMGYRIEFIRFPSSGIVYVDRNANDAYDPGEELDPETGGGYGGVRLLMHVEGYERRIVADRDGQIRTPAFSSAGTARSAQEETADAPAGGAFTVFGGIGGAPAVADDDVAPLVADVSILRAGPLVLSSVHVPVSTYEGGMVLSVNYLALLFALVIYTSAFIGEVVRGGIQAVPKGQREAAQALGLGPQQIFVLVVFPQALRIVLPPVISQYLNLTKNSSLAPLAGYAELFVIATIVQNQTGAAVPIALLLIVSYLFISFVFAFVLNGVNDRLALVER